MTPARLLAPAALVAAAIALFAVVSSGPPAKDTTTETPATAATATPTAKKPHREGNARDTPTPGKGETYTVQSGDTPSGIAQKTGVDVDALLAANPDIDPNTLTVGDELTLP